MLLLTAIKGCSRSPFYRSIIHCLCYSLFFSLFNIYEIFLVHEIFIVTCERSSQRSGFFLSDPISIANLEKLIKTLTTVVGEISDSSVTQVVGFAVFGNIGGCAASEIDGVVIDERSRLSIDIDRSGRPGRKNTMLVR